MPAWSETIKSLRLRWPAYLRRPSKRARDNRTHALLRVYGLFLVLVGVLLTLIATALSHSIGSTPEPYISDGITAMRALGIAVFSVGLVGVLLDFPSWRRYFQDRLAEIVIERRYLRKLKPPELVALQTATLEAFFDTDEIEREGSFLHYFHERLHSLIGSPYREDSQDIVNITLDTETNSLVVKDKISYTCREVAGRMQDFIRWEPEEGEFERIDALTLRLTAPTVGQGISPPEPGQTGGMSGDIVISYEELRTNYQTTTDGFRYPLDPAIARDGLRVTIEAIYRLSEHRFLTWTMAHPTKRFSLIVHYPADLTTTYQLVGIPRGDVTVTDNPGLLSVTCTTWALPDAGLVVQFRNTQGSDL